MANLLINQERTALLQAIAEIIDDADKHRSCYFWSSVGNASARRSYERKHSHDTVEWTENGHTYTAAYDVRCSCKNVYARGTYTKDGKPTTLLAIRNSFKRLKAAEAEERAARMDAILHATGTTDEMIRQITSAPLRGILEAG